MANWYEPKKPKLTKLQQHDQKTLRAFALAPLRKYGGVGGTALPASYEHPSHVKLKDKVRKGRTHMGIKVYIKWADGTEEWKEI